MTSVCSIKVVKSKKAIITKFANGSLKSEDHEKINFRHFTKEEANESELINSVLVADVDTDTCKQYIGETADTSVSSQFYNYFVGVRNKRTGKMKVYEADYFNMIPQLKGPEKSGKGSELLLQSMSYKDKMKELTKAFGSTKRQRLVDQSQKNAIREEVLDSAIGSAVNHAASQDNFDTITTPRKMTEDRNICLPPYDLQATKPEDIYKVEKVIGSKEMLALTTLAQQFYNYRSEEFENTEVYGDYIMNRLPILPLDEARRWEKCKCLMFMHCLLVLYRKRASELKQRDILPKEWPDIVKSSLINNFTIKVEGEGSRRPFRCMSVRMKDKILLHILVLCLIVDNFSLEYTDITKDLKVGERRVPLLLKSIGCQLNKRVINKVPVRTASLEAPLHLPEQNLFAKNVRK